MQTEATMNNDPNSKTQNPLSDDSSTNDSPIRCLDFASWLEAELEELELQFQDYVTAKSNRIYFSR